MNEYIRILKQYWQFEEFRPFQEEGIHAVCQGNDALVILPTGGGKSMIFQISALYLGGITIVVSPLIALMEDQVGQLNDRGIKAYAWHSGLSSRVQRQVLDKVRDCLEPVLLYVSPERLKTVVFTDFIADLNVKLLAVDEAHCISQWGHDFRPAYREIQKIRELLPGIPMIALTATATPAVEKDILDQLEMKNPKIFRQSIYKPDLSLYVYHETDKYKFISEQVKHLKGSGIIYIRHRKGTEEIAQMLSSYGLNGMYFHAGLEAEERLHIQQKWINGEYRYIVATNAFGMGIDKQDVRWIIHMAPVPAVEEYYQEIGRAGRDGQKAVSYMLWNEEDLESMEKIIDVSHPEQEVISEVLRRFIHYFQIPVSSVFVQRDFNLMDFSEDQSLSSFQVNRVFLLLHKMGILEYQEPMHRPGELYIRMKPDQLMDLKDQHPLLYEVVDYYVRSVDDVFWSPVTVDVYDLAYSLQASREDIEKRLDSLHRFHYAKYVKEGEYGQVRFPDGRPDLSRIRYDMGMVLNLKNRQLKGFENMKDYIHTPDCRFQFLQTYFGDPADQKECGHCDAFYRKEAEQGKKVRSAADEMVNSIPEEGRNLAAYVTGSNNEFLAREAVRYLYRRQKITYSDGMVYLR